MQRSANPFQNPHYGISKAQPSEWQADYIRSAFGNIAASPAFCEQCLLPGSYLPLYCSALLLYHLLLASKFRDALLSTLQPTLQFPLEV